MDLYFLGCLLDAAQFLVLFPEIAENSGGSTSCDTQPNCRAPDWLLPLSPLSRLLPLGVGGSEGGAVSGVGFARS